MTWHLDVRTLHQLARVLTEAVICGVPRATRLRDEVLALVREDSNTRAANREADAAHLRARLALGGSV